MKLGLQETLEKREKIKTGLIPIKKYVDAN